MRSKHTKNQLLIGIVLVCLIASLQSCTPNRYNYVVPYLDTMRTVNIPKYPFEYREPTIQPYEFVEVRFAGLNPNVTSTLNNYGGTNLQTQIEDKQGGQSFQGQQVDKEGYLNFPLIGKVKANGLTTSMLRSELLKRVEPILADPYVYVALPRRGVTVMGEVARSSTVTFSKQRANILEILSEVGSTTQYADLSKVKIYRETEDGKRYLGHINLNDTSIFNSEFFYPMPNDIVYVPATKKRALQADVTAYLPFVTLFTTVFTLLITILRN